MGSMSEIENLIQRMLKENMQIAEELKNRDLHPAHRSRLRNHKARNIAAMKTLQRRSNSKK